MVATSGNTRQELALINAKIDTIAMGEAYDSLVWLVKTISHDELSVVLPDIRAAISRFFKKKNKALNILLDERLAGYTNDLSPDTTDFLQSAEQLRLNQYLSSLNKLQSSHIFQWSTYYRDTVGFIFKDLCDFLDATDDWENILLSISNQFSEHAHSISIRGIKYSQQNGLSDEASQYKSIGGLQQFLYLIMNLYIEHQEKIANSKQSRIARHATSAILSGVLSGYSKHLGWDRLCSRYRQWVPALGFINGTDAIALLQEKDFTVDALRGIFDTVVPVLLAIDKLSNKFHGLDFIFPRLSLVLPNDPLKLDITLSTGKATIDLRISSVFSEEIAEITEIQNLDFSNSELSVIRASSIVKNWIEQSDNQRLTDVSHVLGRVDSAYDISEIIVACLEKKIIFNATSDGKFPIVHNYAKDFPLEDPDTRRLFIVERHSVKVSLEQFEKGTGVHLWCSVRRSGKTTAALNLSGRSAVIFSNDGSCD